MPTTLLSNGHAPAVVSISGVNGKPANALKTNPKNDLIKSLLSSNSDQNDPFYVLDIGTVADLYRKWTHHLGTIQPYFAVKCNPEPALIGTLATLGANFDCASRAEIESVLAQGVSADRIIYANPCKADSHVKYARSVGVKLATFDSVYELEKMRKNDPHCRLLLRITPPTSAGARRSLSSKFGALPDEVVPLLRSARDMNLSVVGVAFHIGSSATVVENFDAAIGLARRVFDIADEIGGSKMDVLDIGGGFTAGLFEKAAQVIKPSLAAHFGDRKDLRVIAEPGRYFAETAATLAVRIIGKRVRGDKREYWANDGIYGSLFCMKMDAVDVSIAPLKDSEEGTKMHESTVFGPTCDSLDVVASELPLPEMEVGEWMVLPNMGAYAKAMGSSFNGFSTPAMRVYLANSLHR